MAGLSPRGRLEDVHPLMVLGQIHASRASGIVHFIWASMEKVFWIGDGYIQGGTSTLEGEHVLDFLLPTHPDLAVDYDSLRELSYPTMLERLLHKIPLDEMKRAIGESIRFNISTAVLWFSGEYIWDEHSRVTLPVEVGMSIPRLIWNVLKGFKELDFTLRFIGGLHRIPVPTPNLNQEIESMPFSQEEFFFLTRLDGVHSVDQINTTLQFPRNRLLALLFLAKCCGWLEFHERQTDIHGVRKEPDKPVERPPTPPGRIRATDREWVERVRNFYARIDELNDRAIFGLNDDASIEDLENAYRELMETYHPDHLPADADDLTRAMLEGIRERIDSSYQRLHARLQEGGALQEQQQVSEADLETESVAYWHLRGPVKSKEATRRVVKKEITPDKNYEILMNRALEHIQYSRNYDAVRCLEGAIQLKPEQAEPYYLMATVYASHPKMRRKALECYEQAIQRDPVNELYRSEFVSLLIQEKLYRKALSQVEKLLELNPDNEEYRKIKSRLKKILKQIS